MNKILIENRNAFIGTTVVNTESEQIEISEQRLVSRMMGFLNRLLSLFRVITLLDERTVGKVKLAEDDH